MRRVAHREQLSTGASKMPRYWIFVDTETRESEIRPGVFELPLQMGWAVFWDRVEDTYEWFFFTDAELFWVWVENVHPTRGDQTVNVMSHNAGFDFPVLKWTDNLFGRGWTRGRNVIIPDGAPIPFHVELKRDAQSLKLRDLANYYGMQSLSVIGRSVGMAKMDDVVNYRTEAARWHNAKEGTDDWETLKEYCKRDVEVVWRAMRVWLDFLVTEDLGQLCLSSASQAKMAFRRLMPIEDDGKGPIYYHTEERRLTLERESYMGGRVEIIGRRGYINGPIREFDFNSMYPAVQLHGLFPVRAVRGGYGYSNKPKLATKAVTLKQVRWWIDHDFCIVARVHVDVPHGNAAHIPMKHEGKLIFPTGTFTTVLTTPELLYALENGYVTRVDEYSLYHGRRDLFSDYVNFFYNKRKEYKAQGNGAFEQLCKLLMNSLYGKFGSFRHEWEVVPMPPGVIGDGMTVKIEGRRYRGFGGMVEVRSPDKVEPSESFAAIASHVTAYGRDLLRRAIDVVGPHAPGEGVVYCDTDSLHVQGPAYVRLEQAGMVDPTRLGALKQEDHKGPGVSSDWSIYTAPKDYHLDGKSPKLKGVKKNAQELEPGVWLTDQFRGLAGAFRDGDLNRVLRSVVTKRRSGGYTKGYVTRDERVVPWHFIDNRQVTDPDWYEPRGNDREHSL